MKISSWNHAKRWGLGLTLVLILCLIRLSGSDEPATSCVTESCHQTVYIEGTSNPFFHAPFEEKQCQTCHTVAAIVGTDILETSVRMLTQPIVVSEDDYRTEHAVLLKGLTPTAAYDIYVTVRDVSGERLRREFPGTVPADIPDVKTNDKDPPRIFDVRVGPVSRGVFLETTVTWKTDELSTSLVEYGPSNRYGRFTSEDSTLKKKHTRNIHQLESGRDYYFRVVSRDIFGNEAVSEDLQFSTFDVSDAQAAVAVVGDETDQRDLTLYQAGVFLLNSDVVGVHVETSKPTRIAVEYLKAAESVIAMEDSGEGRDAVLTNDEDSHPALRDGTDLAIDACYQCHPPEELGVSHPVGMEPSGKTTIPDDLPTLAGGVLTCVTCHAPHGGIRRYFARKEITKEICVSCHEGY